MDAPRSSGSQKGNTTNSIITHGSDSQGTTTFMAATTTTTTNSLKCIGFEVFPRFFQHRIFLSSAYTA
jgi:hypothetical protein